MPEGRHKDGVVSDPVLAVRSGMVTCTFFSQAVFFHVLGTKKELKDFYR